jgi:hypothetical protein
MSTGRGVSLNPFATQNTVAKLPHTDDSAGAGHSRNVYEIAYDGVYIIAYPDAGYRDMVNEQGEITIGRRNE